MSNYQLCTVVHHLRLLHIPCSLSRLSTSGLLKEYNELLRNLVKCTFKTTETKQCNSSFNYPWQKGYYLQLIMNPSIILMNSTTEKAHKDANGSPQTKAQWNVSRLCFSCIFCTHTWMLNVETFSKRSSSKYF